MFQDFKLIPFGTSKTKIESSGSNGNNVCIIDHPFCKTHDCVGKKTQKVANFDFNCTHLMVNCLQYIINHGLEAFLHIKATEFDIFFQKTRDSGNNRQKAHCCPFT